jgi:hypothetical protein
MIYPIVLMIKMFDPALNVSDICYWIKIQINLHSDDNFYWETFKLLVHRCYCKCYMIRNAGEIISEE